MTGWILAGIVILGVWSLVAGISARIDQQSLALGSRQVGDQKSTRNWAAFAVALGRARRSLRISAPAGLRNAIERRLVRGGIRGVIDPEGFVLLQFIGLAIGSVVALLASGAGLAGGVPVPVLFLLMGTIGGAAPVAWLSRRSQQRDRIITAQIPDFLDLMALSVSAGLAFDVALIEVSDQIRGPLAEELDLVTIAISLGTSRAQALDQLEQRIDLPQVSSFVMAVNQAAELGSPLGATLQSQAESGRLTRRRLEEERINKLPVKILLPTVLFILPPTLLVVVGPAMVDILEAIG